jgi:cytochrome c oxidase subunit 2
MLSILSSAESTIWSAFQRPIDISTYGHLGDWLFDYITIAITISFLFVCIGLFGFCYYYSAKRNKTPLYTYGYKKAHLKVTLIIGLIVFFGIDAMIAGIANHDLKNTFWNFPKEEEKPLKIEIMAQQWMWNFRYAGLDDEFNTDDDITTNHLLYLPKGRKIEFRLTSKDVIHSFYIPFIRNKVDTIPGRITRLWVELTKTGEFDIACAEMCGTHHYKMKAKLIVLETQEFENWLGAANRLAKDGVDPATIENYWGWKWK